MSTVATDVMIRPFRSLDLHPVIDIARSHELVESHRVANWSSLWLNSESCMVVLYQHAVRAYCVAYTSGFCMYFGLAVHPDYLRHGIGTAIVDYLKDRLDPKRRPWLIALVKERDLRTQLFFKSQGFLARYHCKDLRGEDVYAFDFERKQ